MDAMAGSSSHKPQTLPNPRSGLGDGLLYLYVKYIRVCGVLRIHRVLDRQTDGGSVKSSPRGWGLD